MEDSSNSLKTHIQKTFYSKFFKNVDLKDIEYVNCSCSAWNTARSSYQQYEQLQLFDNDKSDEEIMLKILTDYSHPCKACTPIRIAPGYVPENHEYWVNLPSINGWTFQNHFDCVATAIVGGINAVYGFTRGNSIFSTKDIVHAMDIIHCENATKLLKKHRKKTFTKEQDKALNQIFKKILSGRYAEECNFESSLDFYEKFTNELIPYFDNCNWITSSISRELYQLSILRVLNVSTSFQTPLSVIPRLGIGLSVSCKTKYTFNDIKKWLKQPNTSILIELPAHLGLIFAIGKDKTNGKYPHVLLSRPSGGQSPCGWIPWSIKDRYPGEVLWEDDIEPDPAGIQEAIRTGKISPKELLRLINSKSGITMYLEGRLRRIYIVTKGKNNTFDKTPIDFDPCFLDYDPVKCNTCCNDWEKGDALIHASWHNCFKQKQT